MFEHDLTSTRDYITKTDRRAAYSTFLLSIGIGEREYPFSYKGDALFKGRPCEFKISGFGGYNNADGVWIVYIAYRCPHPIHTIQHTWSWDSENNCVFNYRKMEFVN